MGRGFVTFFETRDEIRLKRYLAKEEKNVLVGSVCYYVLEMEGKVFSSILNSYGSALNMVGKCERHQIERGAFELGSWKIRLADPYTSHRQLPAEDTPSNNNRSKVSTAVDSSYDYHYHHHHHQ